MRVKLVILGQERVGKTRLVNRLAGCTFDSAKASTQMGAQWIVDKRSWSVVDAQFLQQNEQNELLEALARETLLQQRVANAVIVAAAPEGSPTAAAAIKDTAKSKRARHSLLSSKDISLSNTRKRHIQPSKAEVEAEADSLRKKQTMHTRAGGASLPSGYSIDTHRDKKQKTCKKPVSQMVHHLMKQSKLRPAESACKGEYEEWKLSPHHDEYKRICKDVTQKFVN